MFSYSFEILLITGAVLLLMAVFSSKTSSKLGVPLLLIFLAIGMIAGSDGLGKIYFDNAQLAQHIGVIALLFIIFSGGLETDRENIKSVFWQGILLSTTGVILTTLVTGLLSWKLCGLEFLPSLLLGSIMSSNRCRRGFFCAQIQEHGHQTSFAFAFRV